MPKINVYLPDDLAAAVREAGLPISSICQQALAVALSGAGAARETAALLRDPAVDLDRASSADAGLTPPLTPRLTQALGRAEALAGGPEAVSSEHLLVGLLDQPDNLGAQVLRLLNVDIVELREAAAAAAPGAGRGKGHRSAGRQETRSETQPGADEGPAPTALSGGVRLVLADAVDEAAELGHNFLGCEHLLLALAGRSEERAGRLLEEREIRTPQLRRTVIAALGGMRVAAATARQASSTAVADRLDHLERRLARLEGQLGASRS